MKETFNEALERMVSALGGPKAVAIELWPQKEVEAAHKRLLSCLDVLRKERLSPEEVFHIFQMARERDVHIGMEYLAEELGYEIRPLRREPDIEEVLRRYEETTDLLLAAQKQIQQLLAARDARPQLRSVGQ